MKRSSYLLVLMLVWVVAAFSASAATLSARVVLPDGSGAPFATVTIGDKVFTASETGKVEITYDGEKTALVKWLELEEEIAIGATMKFSNRLYYGAPYDANDFVTWGPDIWEITESAMYCPGGLGNEAQIFLDDFYDNFVMRAKFSAEAESQWFYLRFMIRGVEPGFNGYGVTVAMHPADQSSFARFNGSWDNYDVITEVKIPFSSSAYSSGLKAARSMRPPLSAKSAISDPKLKMSGVSRLAIAKRLF
jgi:hypothetical protein